MPFTGRRTGDANRKSELNRFSTFMPPARHSEHIPRASPSLDGNGFRPSEPGPTQSETALSATPSNPASIQGRAMFGSSTEPKTRRFSLMKFRHASDPQISKSYAAAEVPPVPPMPPPPKIITTAPTVNSSHNLEHRQKNRKSRFKLLQRSPKSLPNNIPSSTLTGVDASPSPSTSGSGGYHISGSGLKSTHISFDEPGRLSTNSARGTPPAYGDMSNSALALPVTRLSESSRSDGSTEQSYFASTTTTTHTISTTTTFFRLPRRKKDKPLFPLPQKFTPPETSHLSGPPPSGRPSDLSSRPSFTLPPLSGMNGQTLDSSLTNDLEHPSPLPSPSHSLHAAVPNSFGNSAPFLPRRDSIRSVQSALSGGSASPQAPMRLGQRGRSSTMNSLRRNEAGHDTNIPSGRTSTSTAGRKSFGDLFSLARLRQNADPLATRHGSPGVPGTPGSSKQNSFSLPREPAEPKLPEREENDTPAIYLERLQAAVNRGIVASLLSKSADDFFHAAMRRYMRSFNYFGEPIDMAIRKLLMEVELPKESQHIDRVLQGFADRYHECNPGIYATPEQAYFIAFSILILHTDAFNKNNKHKMQKPDYLRGTRDEGVADDILECFYDNISYTPFIHLEEGLDLGSRLVPHKPRKTLFPVRSSENLRKTSSKDPVDPYTLILDNKLETLRPNLKDVIELADPYNVLGTAELNSLKVLHQAFTNSSVLQIVSARSRPDAFMTALSTTNPAEAQPGIVEIKVAKVGLLWRKDPRKSKKKSRSPWAEWGALLTSSQLYFFRDTAWVKTLIAQYDHKNKDLRKQSHSPVPVTFKPPVTDFRPDALVSIDDAVALYDSSYKKHKHAFTFIRHGGFEEVFLANSDADMADWIATLNYGATFRSAGVRMKGFLGTENGGGQNRPAESLESHIANKSVSTPTGDVQIRIRNMDPQLAREVMFARSEAMRERIAEAEEKMTAAQGQLDLLLRNARHLQILTPIQTRSREALILAAGRMSAKLKWIRLELWRLKVHKIILSRELDDDDTKSEGQTPSTKPSPSKISTTAEKLALTRLDSQTSSPRSIRSGHSHRALSAERDFTNESISQVITGASVTRRASVQGSMVSVDGSASHRDKSTDGRRSIIQEEGRENSRPYLDHRFSTFSQRSSNLEVTNQSDTASRLATPAPSEDGEAQVLRDAGLISPETTSPSKRPGTSDSNPSASPEPNTTTNNFDDRKSRVRRSLQRTLRDSHHSAHNHLPHHQRSKKGRDSASSAGGPSNTGDENNPSSPTPEPESLARKHGSFNFHGKKASVIQFGSEWNGMTPEERLKMHKADREENRESRSGFDKEDVEEFRSVASEEDDEDHQSKRAPSISDDGGEGDEVLSRESRQISDEDVFEDAREHTPMEEKEAFEQPKDEGEPGPAVVEEVLSVA